MTATDDGVGSGDQQELWDVQSCWRHVQNNVSPISIAMLLSYWTWSWCW